AVAEARAMAQSGVRLRLQIDERADRLQSLRWELARVEDRPGATTLVDTATSAATPFSRYVPLAEQDRTPPNDPIFTVLVAVANPTGLEKDLEIPVADEIESLLDEFVEQRLTDISRLHVRVMPGRTLKDIPDALKEKLEAARWTLVDGPTSLRQIQTELQ